METHIKTFADSSPVSGDSEWDDFETPETSETDSEYELLLKNKKIISMRCEIVQLKAQNSRAQQEIVQLKEKIHYIQDNNSVHIFTVLGMVATFLYISLSRFQFQI